MNKQQVQESSPGFSLPFHFDTLVLLCCNAQSIAWIFDATIGDAKNHDHRLQNGVIVSSTKCCF